MSSSDAQIIFRTDAVKIGRFRAGPTHPIFRCSGPPGDHLFVFPREGVWIEHGGRRPFVADPNVVTFYNPRQEYHRSPISLLGDHSDWFALDPAILRTQLIALGLPIDPAGESVFPFLNGPSDPESYLEQRRIVRRIRGGAAYESHEIEVRVIALAARVLGNAARSASPHPDTGAADHHRLLVERARELLAARYREHLQIADIARALWTSPAHLSRVFRRLTGLSIHQYRLRLRLAGGLLELAGRPLTDLAFDLGFSSHSHFSAAFQKLYGAAPREIRRSLGG
jgi:AraC-like DNA-binding protein